MRDADFARLETVLVDDVLFSGEDEPNSLIADGRIFIGIVIIAYECLFRGRVLLLLLFRIDVSQQRGRSSLDLRRVRLER